MSLNFPQTPAVNQEYVVGTKTYRWNGYAWDKVIATVVTPGTGSGDLNAVIDVSWGGPGTQTYSNGRFTGRNIFPDEVADITITWNIPPSDFTVAKLVPLYESTTTTTDQLFTNFTPVTSTVYTVKYKPVATPAQLVIKANSVFATKADGSTTALASDVYSLSISKETRPYVTYDIVAKPGVAGSDAGVTVLDTLVAPAVLRKYVTDGITRNLRAQFVNFKNVFTTASETGITSLKAGPYFFSASDVVIGYFGAGSTAPVNNVSGSGFYINITTPLYQPGTTISAVSTNSIRELPILAGTGSVGKNAILQLTTPAASYTDSAASNIAGPEFYLGLFRGPNIVVYPSVVTQALYTSKVTKVQFQLDHYACLTDQGFDANGLPIMPSASIGSLSAPIFSSAAKSGNFYTCEYTPSSTVLQYTETITVPAGWRKITGTVNNKLTNKSSTGTNIQFAVNSTPVRFISSTLTNDYTQPTISFVVDRPLINFANLLVSIRNTVSGAIIPNVKAVIEANLGTLSKITITLPSTGLIANNNYQVIIPTTLSQDLFGNSLEDLANNASVKSTFTIDSSPVTGTINFDQTQYKPTLTISFNKPLAKIVSTNPFIAVVNNTTGQQVEEINYSASRFAANASLGPSNTTNTIISYVDNLTSKNLIQLNTNRKLRIDNNYTITVAANSVFDRFDNKNTSESLPPKQFTPPKTDLICESSSTDTNSTSYSSNTIELYFPKEIYASIKPNTTSYITISGGGQTVQYATSSSNVRINYSSIIITPAIGFLKESTDYTITLQPDFVEDYFGNQNLIFTTNFRTIALGLAVGQQVYTSDNYNITATSNTFTWIAPLGVSTISVVAIGAGSTLKLAEGLTRTGGGGTLAWANGIQVTPGRAYNITIGFNSYNTINDEQRNTIFKDGTTTLILAQGGRKQSGPGVKATAIFDSSITQNKVLGVDYYSGDGGLSRGVESYGGAGKYAGSTSTSIGTSLRGSTDNNYYTYGTDIVPINVSVESSDNFDGDNQDNSFGALRIVWGPGRSYPNTNVL